MFEDPKDQAYWERNQLVALLSKHFPSWLERHPDDDKEWDDAWRIIVVIELPTGKAPWHIHDHDWIYFSHLPVRNSHSWDGHTTEEKYKRIRAMQSGLHC